MRTTAIFPHRQSVPCWQAIVLDQCWRNIVYNIGTILGTILPQCWQRYTTTILANIVDQCYNVITSIVYILLVCHQLPDKKTPKLSEKF